MSNRLISSLAFLTLAMASNVAGAQYPNKPIHLVVPMTAGSITDNLTRVIAPKLEERLGQPVIVENKPGANGAIAGQYIVRSAPDGYTLLMGTNSPLTGVPALMKSPPYDTMKDFTPIGFVGQFTHFLLVNKDLPVSNLKELLSYAKENPGKLNYGSGHTAALIYGANLKSLGNIDIVQVPYKGEPEQTADLVAGRIHLAYTSPATSVGFINQGRLKALGVVLDERSPILPDVPTMEEGGIPGFANISWMALVGPADMPREIVERLNKELNVVLNMPDVREHLEKQALKVNGSTPEQLDTMLRDQLRIWRDAVEEAGIERQ